MNFDIKTAFFDKCIYILFFVKKTERNKQIKKNYF